MCCIGKNTSSARWARPAAHIQGLVLAPTKSRRSISSEERGSISDEDTECVSSGQQISRKLIKHAKHLTFLVFPVTTCGDLIWDMGDDLLSSLISIMQP